MNDYCMKFTNEEIIWFLVDTLRTYEHLDIHLFTEHDEKILGECEKRIGCVTFDGASLYDTEMFIQFYDYQAILFLPRTEAFHFIDDRAIFSSSDVYGDVVYEGNLTDKTSAEILELLGKFILLLAGATNIEIERYPQERILTKSYEVCDFIIKVTNNSDEKKEVVFDNIKFIINGNLDN